MDFFNKSSSYALLIPVLNEGERIRTQLQRLKEYNKLVDIIVVDGGSKDGAVTPELLQSCGVRSLQVISPTPGLGAQLKLGIRYAVDQGYEGCILIDGNGKDDPAAIPHFIKALKENFDFVQGSRFIPGGKAINTPKVRYVAIRLIHAPLMSLAARVKYSDTTNGFRAYSRKFLTDARIAPVFSASSTEYLKYDLHYYLSFMAGRLGFKVCEIPVTRAYPKSGKTPTKISFVRGNLEVLGALLKVCMLRLDKNK